MTHTSATEQDSSRESAIAMSKRGSQEAIPESAQSPGKKRRKEEEKLGSFDETAASVCKISSDSQAKREEQKGRKQGVDADQSGEQVLEDEGDLRTQNGYTSEAGPGSSQAGGGNATVDSRNLESASAGQHARKDKAIAATDGSISKEEYKASSQADEATRHRQSSGVSACTSETSPAVEEQGKDSRLSPGWLHGVRDVQNEAGRCQTKSFGLPTFMTAIDAICSKT